MRLLKAKSVGVSGGKMYSNYFDFKKDIIKSREAWISSDTARTEIIPIKYDGFKKLSEFGSMNDWEVAKYKYL